MAKAKSFNDYLIKYADGKVASEKLGKKHVSKQVQWNNSPEGKLGLKVLDEFVKLMDEKSATFDFVKDLRDNPLFTKNSIMQMSYEQLDKLNVALKKISELLSKTSQPNIADAIKIYVDVLNETAPYISAGSRIASYGKKAYDKYVTSLENGDTKSVPGNTTQMSSADAEIVNALKFMGIEIEYDGKEKKWKYSKEMSDQNPNGFRMGDGVTPYKLSETMVNAFLDGHINKTLSERTLRLSPQNLFDSYLAIIRQEYMPTIDKSRKKDVESRLEKYKEFLNVNGDAWKLFQKTSSVTVSRQASLRATGDLIREACGDMDVVLGAEFKLSDALQKRISDNDAVATKITGAVCELATKSQEVAKSADGNGFIDLEDEYLKSLTEVEKALTETKKELEDGKQTDGEEYKRIVSQLAQIDDARKMYTANVDFKSAYIRDSIIRKFIKDDDQLQQFVDEGLSSLDLNDFAFVDTERIVKRPKNPKDPSKYKTIEFSQLCDMVSTSSTVANGYELEMGNGELDIKRGVNMGGTKKSRAADKKAVERVKQYIESVRNDPYTYEKYKIDKGNNEAELNEENAKVIMAEGFGEWTKKHIPDVLAYVMESNEAFSKTMTEQKSLSLLSFMFQPNNYLSIVFDEFVNKNPEIKDKSKQLEEFVNSISAYLPNGSLKVPLWVYKVAYNSSRPADQQVELTDQDKLERSNLDSNYSMCLVLMDRVANSLTPDEYARFVDPKYPDDLKQRLINEKYKEAKAKGKPTPTETLIARQRQDSASMYLMIRGEYGDPNNENNPNVKDNADTLFVDNLKRYLLEKKQIKEANDNHLNKTVDMHNYDGCCLQAGTTKQPTAKKYGDLYPEPTDHTKYLKDMSKYNKKAVVKEFIIPLLKAIQQLQVTQFKAVQNPTAEMKGIRASSDAFSNAPGVKGADSQSTDAQSEQETLGETGQRPTGNGQQKKVENPPVQVSQEQLDAMLFMPGIVATYVSNDQVQEKNAIDLNDVKANALSATGERIKIINDLFGFLSGLKGFNDSGNLEEIAVQSELRQILKDYASGKSDKQALNGSIADIFKRHKISDEIKTIIVKGIEDISPEQLLAVFEMSSELEKSEGKDSTLKIVSKLPAEIQKEILEAKTTEDMINIIKEYYKNNPYKVPEIAEPIFAEELQKRQEMENKTPEQDGSGDDGMDSM